MSQVQKATSAAKCYIARKNRTEHPDGKCDSGGRWYPTEGERQACCHNIRTPSRRWPWSLVKHCRTKKHVANLFGVTVAEINKAIKEMQDK